MGNCGWRAASARGDIRHGKGQCRIYDNPHKLAKFLASNTHPAPIQLLQSIMHIEAAPHPGASLGDPDPVLLTLGREAWNAQAKGTGAKWAEHTAIIEGATAETAATRAQAGRQSAETRMKTIYDATAPKMLRGRQWAILAAMSVFALQNNECWASNKSIGKCASALDGKPAVTEQNVRRATDRLEQLGLIERAGVGDAYRGRPSVRWRINIEKIQSER